MNNCGVPAANSISIRVADTATIHYSLFIIHFSLPSPLGWVKKESHPLKKQGWDTKVFHGSTLVASYLATHWHYNGCARPAISGRQLRSGIAPNSSKALSPDRPLSGKLILARVSSSQLFNFVTIAYIFQIVNLLSPGFVLWFASGGIFCLPRDAFCPLGSKISENATKSVYHNYGYGSFPSFFPPFPYFVKFSNTVPYILCVIAIWTS